MKNFILRLLLLLFIVPFSCTKENKNVITNSSISTAHPLASQAGKKMYEQNGNAFDAAVAAGFTLAVVEPSMSGIGGRLQAIYRNSSGKIGGVDASTQVPMNYKKMNKKYSYGYKTIGIPGVVAGLLKLHESYGSLSLKKVMAPAIEFAEKGFRILPLESERQKSVKKYLLEFEGSKFHFLNSNGNSFKSGDLVIQMDLAKTLKKIANEGKKGFYEGEVARKIVSDIQSNGGILTIEDLKNYNALDSKVVKGFFNGNDIFSLNLPSFGAITIQILQIMDNLNFPVSENEWALKFDKVTSLAYKYRDFQDNLDSLSKILSYDQAKIWAKKIENNQIDIVKNTDLKTPYSWIADGHTTHLTTADKMGNVVSLTQTIGPTMGSKVATKGLGFLYAVSLGGYLGEYKPGDRSNSHISPTLFMKNGKVQLALGAAGGSRIPTAITQVAHRYLSQKKDLNTSLMLPRIYPYEDSLWIEDHDEVKSLNADLDQNVYPVKLVDEKARFGRVHAISYDSISNSWFGSADPDWEGTVEYHTDK